MIKKIFDEIAAEPGSNKKMEILSSYKDNELLKRVLYLACSKRIKFYIKQIPVYSSTPMFRTLDLALDQLSVLSNREKTGHEAIAHLADILSHLSSDDAYIVERIIDKDPKIGMGTTYINKVFPKLIEETPYMGAKAYDIKLVKKLFEKGKKAFSQIKMDGRYCNAIIRGGEVELESRQGEPTILVPQPKFISELTRFSDCVLNGELTIPGIPRYESNGIIASLISISKKVTEGKDVTKEIAEFEKEHMNYYTALNSIVYTVWDTITVEEYFEAKSSTPYKQRIANLGKLILDAYNNDSGDVVAIGDMANTGVRMVEGTIVTSFEEAMEHFQEMLNRGEEGTILKAEDGTWKDGKHNHQIKMKLEMNVDLMIVGFNYGTGKNSNVISSINATSSDGIVNTRPTGIDEKMMSYITENQNKLLNTILEVKCSGLSKDGNWNYALLHPVFKKLRDDKNTCDSLNSIKKIEAMAKGLS